MNQPKIWLITGVSSGLGQALAQSVMAAGGFVVGTQRDAAAIAAFNQQHTGNGVSLALDLTNEVQIEQMVQDVIGRFGRIDVLVNNAGMGFVGAVEEASIDETRKVFETNFFGTLKMTQAVLPHMRAAKQGHVVQISSHGGIKAFAGFGIYNASKFALEGFSEALALEVAPLGIQVTIVEPGPFRTHFAGEGLGQAERLIDDYAETAGVFRTRLQGVHGKQEGDPAKAALAILDRVSAASGPLRMPLGKTALVTIGMKLDSVRADLESGRQVAEGAVFQ